MIRYYKLFDLLNRKDMKKSDLREILAPKTIAKLSKGEYISGEVIDKICKFLHCQPGDIMEYIEQEKIDDTTTKETVPQLFGGDYIAFHPSGEEEEPTYHEYRLDMEYMKKKEQSD